MLTSGSSALPILMLLDSVISSQALYPASAWYNAWCWRDTRLHTWWPSAADSRCHRHRPVGPSSAALAVEPATSAASVRYSYSSALEIFWWQYLSVRPAGVCTLRWTAVLTATASWNCTMTLSPHYWMNRFLFGPRSVAVDCPTCGSMTNAGQRNVRCGHLSVLTSFRVFVGHHAYGRTGWTPTLSQFHRTQAYDILDESCSCRPSASSASVAVLWPAARPRRWSVSRNWRVRPPSLLWRQRRRCSCMHCWCSSAAVLLCTCRLWVTCVLTCDTVWRSCHGSGITPQTMFFRSTPYAVAEG